MASVAVRQFAFAEIWESAPCHATGLERDRSVAGALVKQTREDSHLMQRVAAGDEGAYRAIVDGHLPTVLGFTQRMLGNRAEAEEVCQETFLRMWQHADTYVPRAKLSTWLCRIAHNLAIDRLRRRGASADPAVLDEVESEAQQPDAGGSDLANALTRALGELPERQRTAIGLVHLQGMTNAEAAEVLGVGLRALESLLARGRRALRERLSPLLTEGEP